MGLSAVFCNVLKTLYLGLLKKKKFFFVSSEKLLSLTLTSTSLGSCIRTEKKSDFLQVHLIFSLKKINFSMVGI